MSLQIWLPLNGNLNNQGIASCTVTAAGGVSVNDNGPKAHKCYYFNGTTGKLQVNSTAFTTCFAGGSQPFTLCFWLKHQDTNRGTILGRPTFEINFELRATANSVWRVYWGGQEGTLNNTAPSDNQWHHTAIVYTGTQLLGYKDGELVDTRTITLNTRTVNPDQLLMSDGREATATNGYLSDFRVYDTALSAKEIKQIVGNLVLHYPLAGYPNSNLHIGFSTLPSEYQEVEYIEANGTGIGLNIGLNLEDDGFSIRYQATKTNHNGMILANDTSPYMWVYYYGAVIHAIRVYAVATDGNQKGSENVFNDDLLEHNITVKNKKIYGDNILKGDFSSYTFTNIGSNLRLFDGYGTSYYFYGRVFSCRFFNNSTGNCTHNFIPCYRKSDSRIGFYDIITNTFCCNNNNTNLTTGKLIKSLPNTYYPLDYIQSTGTQYINAGTTFSNTSEREFDVIWTSVNAPLYGANSGGSQEVILQINNSGLNYLNGSFTWLWYANKRYKIYLSNLQGAQKLIVNDELIRSTGGTPCGKNEYILGYIGDNGASNNTISHKAEAKLYYYFIKNNNVPIRDLRPALRISDKKPGLYDLVNDVFYVNAGSGEFSYNLQNIEYNCGNQLNINLQGTCTNNIINWLDIDTPRYRYSYKFTDGKGITSGAFTNNFNNSFTITWWMKTTLVNTAMPWGSLDGNRLNFYLNSSQVHHNTNDGNQNPYQVNGANMTTSETSDGQWHHWALTGNGTVNNLYKDGVFLGVSKTYKGFNATQIHINGWAENDHGFATGNVSDFRIYNTVLSADEIKELYDMGEVN